jgi:hypothetical protein
MSITYTSDTKLLGCLIGMKILTDHQILQLKVRNMKKSYNHIYTIFLSEMWTMEISHIIYYYGALILFNLSTLESRQLFLFVFFLSLSLKT